LPRRKLYFRSKNKNSLLATQSETIKKFVRNNICPNYKIKLFSSINKTPCILFAAVGLRCVDNVECQSIANGECKQNTCTCKDNFFLDNHNSSNCISRK